MYTHVYVHISENALYKYKLYDVRWGEVHEHELRELLRVSFCNLYMKKKSDMVQSIEILWQTFLKSNTWG